MSTRPTMDDVRAAIGVPATALSDADLQRIYDSCDAAQRSRCNGFIHGIGVDSGATLTPSVDAARTLTLTSAGTLAVGDWRAYWGDGTTTDFTEPPGTPPALATHTYASDGDYDVAVAVLPDLLRYRAAFVVSVIAGVAHDDAPVPVLDYQVQVLSEALNQAFIRRIQREVAARNLPLGMVGIDAEYGATKLPANDTLVEDAERPYRKQVLA